MPKRWQNVNVRALKGNDAGWLFGIGAEWWLDRLGGAEGKNIANIVVYGKRAIVGFVCKGKSRNAMVLPFSDYYI